MRIVFAFAALCCFALAAAGEPDVTVTRDIPIQSADRERLARGIAVHDFENRRNPDTGAILPESADMNNDGWPDFWEPILAVGYPEYLINGISIVEDRSGQIPGSYRDIPNHVLRLAYDGTRVGIRTTQPVPVDPAQAYEFSLRTRDTGLKGAAIRAGVDWLRVEPAAVEILRTDAIPNLATGQADWPVEPWRMLVSDPPARANAARLFVVIERLPDAVGGAYHGEAFLDDISFKRHPRILVGAPRAAGAGRPRAIPVVYAGLFDNIPDAANPGFFKGRRYNRRVDVTDIFGRPIQTGAKDMQPVNAGDDGRAVESISFPEETLGVYYFGIRLYDADDRLVTHVVRAVAVMRPERSADGLAAAARPAKPVFGVRAGVVPDSVLASPGALRAMLARSGGRMTKVAPWSDSYVHGKDEPRYLRLADEIRLLRSAGLGVTGVVRPPSAMFGTSAVGRALLERADQLKTILDEAGRGLGLFMDGWQFGEDGDGSMQGMADNPRLDGIMSSLAEFAGGLPLAWNLVLDGAAAGPFPRRPDVIDAYIPAAATPGEMWTRAAPLFPWLYERFHAARGKAYPPEILTSLAPPPAADMVEEQARMQRRTGVWLSVEPEAADPVEPNAAVEKTQLERLMVRGVRAAALAPDAVFLGELFDPESGLLRRDATGDNILETMARPAYLGAGTLAGMLEGSEYLGRLGLMEPFEAHVFRRANADDAVIALWHNDPAEEKPLPRVEIAEGPPLRITDWAGNQTPLPRTIPVRRVPAFITGLPASLALTRMSVRISPEPPVLAVNRRQNQELEVVNHLARQAPILFRLRYAARSDDGAMEGGWTVAPEELRVNLPPSSSGTAPGRARFSVSPDPNSQIQKATPAGADKGGGKVARVAMSVQASPPADMVLYLPFHLRSEIDVDVEHLARVDDPGFVTLQLKVRWFPSAATRRRGEIKLTPFYQKWGQMKEPAAFPVTVKALPAELRGKPDAPYESMELRIPRVPEVRTWVGLTEDGGSGFYLADVTEMTLGN